MATLEVVTARVVLDEAGAAREEELLEELLLVEPPVVLVLSAALGDEWLELELELPQAATTALRSRTASTVISGRLGFIEGILSGWPETGAR